MASPPKPWESVGVNRQSPDGSPATFMSSGPPVSGAGAFGMASASPVGASASTGGPPPPIPTRPSEQSNYSTFGSSVGGYGTSYGAGYSPYGGGGGYGGMYSSPYSSMYGGGGYGGSYGGYGMGYNRMGYGQNDYGVNSFSRAAEESSRPAFQSIESIIGAFSSVTMMLDSTFQAVYNSFRAVVGVADNFTRMKMQFAQIFSAFALFRTLRYLCRRLLVLLRLRPQGYAEDAWSEAGDALVAAAASRPDKARKSSWPVMMFFAIIMGGPYLIWKFLQTAFSNQADGPAWASGEEDHFVAQAQYDFAGDGTDELTFQAGQNICVAPKEIQPRVKGWLLASVDGKKIGLIPANYVKVLGKRRGRKYQAQLPSAPEDLQNQGIPTTQTGAQSFTGPGTSPSLIQSESALNLEQSTGAGFQEPASNMDSIFQSSSNEFASSPNAGAANMNAEDILDQS